MSSHSLEAYLNLIQKLLDCPKGEEWALLQQHEDSIDPELLKVMERVASELAAEGNVQAAKFLRHWEAQLAHVLSQSARPASGGGKAQAYIKLIQALLDCPKGSEREILAANRELVDGGLVEAMEQVAAQMAARGDRETAIFLGNLAADLKRSLAPPTPPPQVRREQETPEAAEGGKRLEELTELLSQLQDNLGAKESVPISPPAPLETGREEGIGGRLEAIAESLSQLGGILTSRLPSPDPLWYMAVLERAEASHWLLTSDEVEGLIGVKPRCQAGRKSFQRGCWIFVRAGKIGGKAAWRVTKEGGESQESEV